MQENVTNKIAVNIEDEMKRSYMDYAMSVIIGRALPDVRDGLKPVHRRCLFAMHDMSNDWNKPYKKPARVVGDVIGKHHPHGDMAVYDTIVRMAQNFSLRYMLVDGQGNFGSVDGDNAAAMRYTEIRMQQLTHELLADIEKETEEQPGISTDAEADADEDDNKSESGESASADSDKESEKSDEDSDKEDEKSDKESEKSLKLEFT